VHPTRSLEGRLILVIGLWSLAATAVIAWLLGGYAESIARRGLDQRLAVAADQIAASAEIGADGILLLGRPPDETGFQRARSGWSWIVVRERRAIAQSRSLAGEDVPAGWLADPPAGAGPLDTRVALATRPIRAAARGLPGRLVAAAPIAEVEAEARAMQRAILWVMAILAVLLVAGLVVQVRWTLAPLRRLAGEIEGISDGRRETVGRPGVAELDPLAGAVNRLAGALTRSADRARAEAANLAHAIKTPLSVILLRASGRGSGDAEIVASADRIQRQIDSRLRRSRTGAPSGLRRHRTSLFAVVEDAVLAASRVHAARRVTATIDVPDSLLVAAARDDVEEVVGNLVDNAFKWALGRVVVRAAESSDGLDIVVEDDGPGIPADRIADVLSRGRRLDESVPGSGLGLAIASGILADHGGTLTLAASPLGGLSAAIRWPTDPA
jgi:signal transduction histidine kinase